MKYKYLLACLFFAMSVIVNGQRKESDFYDIKIKKISDDIYLAYRTDPLRKFVQGNVTIIINKNDVVLVDAGGSVMAAKNIIAEVKKLTKNPIRYIINTHFHADHTLGSEEYLRVYPGVEIISHSLTNKDNIEKTASLLENFRTNFDTLRNSELDLIKEVTQEAKPGYEKVVAYLFNYANKDIFTRRDEYAILKITPATLVCDQKIILNRGSRTIEIMSIGSGDTPGDLVVYLPEDKVICSGDMVVHPFPYGFSKNPVAWIETLKKLADLKFDFLVPGHGDLQNGSRYVLDIVDLLQSVHIKVKDAIAKGINKEVLQEEIDLSYFTKKYHIEDPVSSFWFKNWFSDPAIDNAYRIYNTPKTN